MPSLIGLSNLLPIHDGISMFLNTFLSQMLHAKCKILTFSLLMCTAMPTIVIKCVRAQSYLKLLVLSLCFFGSSIVLILASFISTLCL